MLDKNQLNEKKKIIRSEISRRNNELDKAYTDMADEKIKDYILNSKEYINSNIIFCFVSSKNEVNTIPIIEDALRKGKKIGVPRCIGKGTMEVYNINSLDDLEVGKYNILEPREYCPRMEPDELQMTIVPCVTCNYKGHRLGHGGGYYDRYLKNLKAKKVIICRDKITYDHIPLDEHDIQMNILITEKGIFEI